MEENDKPTPLENREPLDPKPPKTIQHIEWFRRYGWRYRWHVLGALLLMALTTLAPILWKHFPLARASSKKETNQSSEPRRTTEVERVRTPSEGKKSFLTTRETPAEILQGLRGYSDSERKRQANAIYVGRWLQNPWIGNVLGLPEQSEDGLWSISLNVETDFKKGTGFEFAILNCEQDASQLRPGMRIRISGRISEVRLQAVCLSDVTFEVVP